MSKRANSNQAVKNRWKSVLIALVVLLLIAALCATGVFLLDRRLKSNFINSLHKTFSEDMAVEQVTLEDGFFLKQYLQGKINGVTVTGTNLDFDKATGMTLSDVKIKAQGVDIRSGGSDNILIRGVLKGSNIARFMSKDNGNIYSFNSGKYTIKSTVQDVDVQIKAEPKLTSNTSLWVLGFIAREATTSDPERVDPTQLVDLDEEFSKLKLDKEFSTGMKLSRVEIIPEGLSLTMEQHNQTD